MTFDARNATGKAGERFVESFVEEQLKFAYRSARSPDIGIDGEIELLDDNRSATGGFIKVQVKATEKSLVGTKFKVPFDEAHMNYFDALTIPPILTVVSLADRAIWWRPILYKENYRGSGGGFGIPIDTNENRLTIHSKPLLRLIGERSNALIAKYLIDEAEEELDEIDEAEQEGNWDFVSVELWVQSMQLAEKMLREAKTLLKYERRYTEEITGIETRLELVLGRISERRAWFTDWGCDDLLSRDYWSE